jgi:hypothetical protein
LVGGGGRALGTTGNNNWYTISSEVQITTRKVFFFKKQHVPVRPSCSAREISMLESGVRRTEEGLFVVGHTAGVKSGPGSTFFYHRQSAIGTRAGESGERTSHATTNARLLRHDKCLRYCWIGDRQLYFGQQHGLAPLFVRRQLLPMNQPHPLSTTLRASRASKQHRPVTVPSLHLYLSASELFCSSATPLKPHVLDTAPRRGSEAIDNA